MPRPSTILIALFIFAPVLCKAEMPDEFAVQQQSPSDLLKKGNLALRKGRYQQAKRVIAELKQIQASEDINVRTSLLLLESKVVANADGDYLKAYELALDCLEIVRKQGNISKQWQALRWLGNYSNAKGQKLLATQYHQHALRLVEQHQVQEKIARSQIDLASSYFCSGLYDRAETLVRELEAKHPFLHLQVKILRAQLAVKRGRLEAGIAMLEKVVLVRQMKGRRLDYELSLALGEMYLEAGRAEKAKGCFLYMVNDKSVMSRAMRSKARLGMARFYGLTGEFDSALKILNDLIRSEYLPSLRKRILNRRAEFASWAGRPEEAARSLNMLTECEVRIEQARMNDELQFVAQRQVHLERLQASQIAAKEAELLERKLKASRNVQVLGLVSALLLILGIVISGIALFRKRMAEKDLASKRKLLDQESRLNLELKERIRDRVADLELQQQEQLRLERELNTKRRDEALGKLTGGVAHDFNNLITVVQNVNEIVIDQFSDQLSQEMKELLGCSQQATRTAADITDRLLVFAKKQQLQPGIIDLNAFLKSYEALIQQAVGLRNRCSIVMDGDAFIYADESQFLSALINLCVNASDALVGQSVNPEVKIIVRRVSTGEFSAETQSGFVKIASVHSQGEMVLVSVRDNGHGMDEQTVQSACDPFYSTKFEDGASQLGGAGLGLSVVKGFLETSNAGLGIYSELEIGTTLRMIFPAVSESVLHRPEPKDEEDVDLQGLRLIVVDDNEMLLRTVCFSLESKGCAIKAFTSGTLAQKYLSETKEEYDFLLTDIRMPQSIDGIALGEWVSINLPQLRVVLMTGYNDQDVSSRLPVLQKPFQQTHLFHLIHSMKEGQSKT